jgi:hypothetical protein
VGCLIRRLEFRAWLWALSVPRSTEPIFGKVIILGGSVAGLLAARVLADYAETVLIIDRDEVGIDATGHPGVPQGAHLHTLLPGGRVQLDRWFPGISAEAVLAGSVVVAMENFRLYIDGKAQLNPHSDVYLSSSRPFLEAPRDGDVGVHEKNAFLAWLEVIAARTGLHGGDGSYLRHCDAIGRGVDRSDEPARQHAGGVMGGCDGGIQMSLTWPWSSHRSNF